MTEISAQYDEECPMYEDDTWAVPFNLFSMEKSLLVDPIDSSYPEFMEEVYARRKILPSGGYQWIEESIVGVYDSKSKREMFKEYFSQENPTRLFRSEIEFYLSFHNWVDPTKPFSKMISRLKEQIKAVSLIDNFHRQGKVKITNVDDSPALLYFIVTPDVFKEVFANPGIGYTLNFNELATLAQDHYNDETETSYISYQQE